MAKKSKVNNIRDDVADYLSTRKALGFKLHDAERLLPQFLDFMEHKKARFITTALALEWAIQNPNCQVYRWASRLSVVRCFARFRRASDSHTEIPLTNLLPYRYRRKRRDIHSDEDVSNLLKAAKQTRSPKGLWADTHFTVLGLLAATGMRVGEVVALGLPDLSNYVLRFCHYP
jgi:site-specific recombinase XerD